MDIGNINSQSMLNTAMNTRTGSAIEAAEKVAGGTGGSVAERRKVAEDFVAFFMGEMFKSMDEGNDCEGIGQGGSTEKMWREMSFEEYGKTAAATPGNGLTDMIYNSLTQKAAMQAYGA